MPRVLLKAELAASPELLWKAIGSFQEIGKWHPLLVASETRGEGAGAIRRLELAGGQGALVERLERLDDRERCYSYSIVDGPLPVSSCVCEIRVRDNGDGTSTVEWSSEFTPAGAQEIDIIGTIQGVCQAGLDNLARLYGARK